MKVSVPLSPADAYLQAVERMMLAQGQGHHWGVTIVKLGPGVDVAELQERVEWLARQSALAGARLRHRWGGLPAWIFDSEAGRVCFPLEVHAAGKDLVALCHERLNGRRDEAVLFDLVPSDDGATLVMTWRHALLDGKGVELLLAELATGRIDGPSSTPQWGPARERKVTWRGFLEEARRFKECFNEQARLAIRSLGGAEPRAGAACFALEHFTATETSRMAQRAQACSEGLFMLPWFLAVAVRVHRAVHLQRGAEPESYQASCAVPERKRGARGPIWQNQVSQLFFCLKPGDVADLRSATRAVQEQFGRLTRARMAEAFSTMAGLLRRLPSGWYLRFLRSSSGGHLTSFFHSYTGAFLPEVRQIAGAPVLDGWHIPSVPAPPGTGLFFSERDGRLTATLSWREGAITSAEVQLMRETLRAELLES